MWWWSNQTQQPFVQLIEPAPQGPWTSVSMQAIPVAQPGGPFLPSYIPIMQIFPRAPYAPNPLTPVASDGSVVWPNLYPQQDMLDSAGSAYMMRTFFAGGALG